MMNDQTGAKGDSGSESANSRKKEEGEDKVRIYDKTTKRMKEVHGVSSSVDVHGQTPTKLLQTIRLVLGTVGNYKFDVSSYFLLHGCLNELISSHSAEFVRPHKVPMKIYFQCCSETICFDDSLRKYFREILSPIQSTPLKEIIGQLCCIYRFRCIHSKCKFNYVGQSINFQARYKTHTGEMLEAWMNHEDRLAFVAEGMPFTKDIHKTPPSVLYEHQIHEHPNATRFSDVFEVEIVQGLSENASNTTTDKRVRRSWEIYNQWLYEAMASEGGGSLR
jgi:hypothetical protein